MLPAVVVPWIRSGYVGASDYELHSLVVGPRGSTRFVRGVTPRASAPGGRWIGVGTRSQRPLTLRSDGRMRAAHLAGPFMTEPDFGGELAISARLRLSALAGRGRVLLQRWEGNAGGRIVGSLPLPDGARLEPNGAAWDGRGRLVVGAQDGPGWLYAFRDGHLRLLGRPRFGGAVVGWVNGRVLVHEKQPWTADDRIRPRLTDLAGKTVSVGPTAIAVGTDGRRIVMVLPTKRGGKPAEVLSWRDDSWRPLSRPVLLPTRENSEWEEGTNANALLPLSTARGG